jgi:hypothetical protein
MIFRIAFNCNGLLNLSHNLSNPNPFLQRMNNTRADMFHDLVCEHRKLSDAHSKLQLELAKKGNLCRHTSICRTLFLFFTLQY